MDERANREPHCRLRESRVDGRVYRDRVADFRVLFVCIGNICRSPLGEGLLRHALPAEGFEVSSAGVLAMVGSAMAPEATLELESRGGSVEHFRSRQLTEQMVQESDLVLTATREIRSRVLEDSPSALRRTFTVREFASLLDVVDATTPGEIVSQAARKRSYAPAGSGQDIADPYLRGDQAHALAAEQMNDAVMRIAKAFT